MKLSRRIYSQEQQLTFTDQMSQICLVVPFGRTFVTVSVTTSTHIITPIHIFPSDEKSI